MFLFRGSNEPRRDLHWSDTFTKGSVSSHGLLHSLSESLYTALHDGMKRNGGHSGSWKRGRPASGVRPQVIVIMPPSKDRAREGRHNILHRGCGVSGWPCRAHAAPTRRLDCEAVGCESGGSASVRSGLEGLLSGHEPFRRVELLGETGRIPGAWQRGCKHPWCG